MTKLSQSAATWLTTMTLSVIAGVTAALTPDANASEDRDRGDVAERLGAVAGLEQEGAPLDRLAERAQERPRLTGEDEGRQLSEALPDGLHRGRVGPLRLLQRGQRAPRGRRPGLGHGHANECSARRFDASRQNG